jgi:di/tricarboxylate transporter
MTFEQIIVLSTLGVALVLFAWGRWRYDIVALISLLAVVLTGIIPARDAFLGFAHPAVITVAAILIISYSLREAGLVDYLASFLNPLSRRPAVHVAALTGLAAACSGFMNDVGALALFMPIAMATARKNNRSPGIVLMPLAFGSILGGLLTLIGTPPNIIIANYRAEVSGTPFGLFDYTPVGIMVTLAGVTFVALIGWRFLPLRRRKYEEEPTFEVADYITELRVAEDTKIVGQQLRTLERMSNGVLVVAALIRGKRKRLAPSRDERLEAGDLLLVQGDPSELDELIEQSGLVPVSRDGLSQDVLQSEHVDLVEAVIVPGSPLEGRNPLSGPSASDCKRSSSRRATCCYYKVNPTTFTPCFPGWAVYPWLPEGSICPRNAESLPPCSSLSPPSWFPHWDWYRSPSPLLLLLWH